MLYRYELDTHIPQYLIELLLCAMKLYILLHISLPLQSWIVFCDIFRTLHYIIWYIFQFSSYVEQLLLLEPIGGMLCAVILVFYCGFFYFPVLQCPILYRVRLKRHNKN
jgi:hypothetical protein